MKRNSPEKVVKLMETARHLQGAHLLNPIVVCFVTGATSMSHTRTLRHIHVHIALFCSGTSPYRGVTKFQSKSVYRTLECNAGDKAIGLSRPVAVLGNLQCKGSQEASLAFAKGESAFHLAEEGQLASGDKAIRVDDFVTIRILGILEFGERKGSTNRLRPLAKASDGLAVTESI